MAAPVQFGGHTVTTGPLTGRNVAIAYAYAAGFRGKGLDIAVAVAMAESGGNPNNTSHNPGSIDRGLFQINNKYHPEVSDKCAYDALCNAKAAYRISHGGTNWKPWATYNSGKYRQYYAHVDNNAISAAVGRVGKSDGGILSTIGNVGKDILTWNPFSGLPGGTAASDAGGALEQAAASTPAAIGQVLDFFKNAFSFIFSLRGLQVLGGGVIVIIALVMLARNA